MVWVSNSEYSPLGLENPDLDEPEVEGVGENVLFFLNRNREIVSVFFVLIARLNLLANQIAL
jgi:hypothetical protein